MGCCKSSSVHEDGEQKGGGHLFPQRDAHIAHSPLPTMDDSMRSSFAEEITGDGPLVPDVELTRASVDFIINETQQPLVKEDIQHERKLPRIRKITRSGVMPVEKDGIIEFRGKKDAFLKVPDADAILGSICDNIVGESFSLTICNRGTKTISIMGGSGVMIVTSINIGSLRSVTLRFVVDEKRKKRYEKKEGEDIQIRARTSSKVDDNERKEEIVVHSDATKRDVIDEDEGRDDKNHEEGDRGSNIVRVYCIGSC